MNLEIQMVLSSPYRLQAMLVRSIKLPTCNHETSRPLFRSLSLLANSITPSSRPTQAFQRCSAINRDQTCTARVRRKSDASIIRRTWRDSAEEPGQRRRRSSGRVRLWQGHNLVYRASRLKRSPQTQYTIASHTKLYQKDSGYGWTSVIGEGSSLEHCLNQVPITKLSRYEDPLLVILISPQAVGIEKELKNIAFQILSKLYHPVAGGKLNLQVLFAYVDKVSIPTNAARLMSLDKIIDGAHGCSFWWTSRSKLHITPVTSGLSGGQANTQVQGSLTVHINRIIPKSSRRLPPFSRLRVPLTNTTFITGHDYTMHLQKMTWKGVKKRKDKSWAINSYSAKTLLDLGYQNAVLEIDSSQEVLVPQAHSYVTSSRLTPWRSTIDISGNVIKTVQGPDGPLPASTELETAIARLDPAEYGHFEVWGEIRFNKDDIHDKHIAGLSRYVKVISGGGGWGEKRGLIALDPGPSEDTSSEDLPDELDFTKLLPNILEPGDELRFVKFSIDRSGHESTEDKTSVGVSSRVSVQNDGRTTFAFGTTGNPELESSTTSSQESHMYGSDRRSLLGQTIFGHFGAMTQRMHYECAHTAGAKNEKSSAASRQSHATNLPPFTYLSDSNEFTVPPKSASFKGQKTASRPLTSDQEPPANTISNDDPFHTDSDPSHAEVPLGIRKAFPLSQKKYRKSLVPLHYYDPKPEDIQTSTWAREEKLVLANLTQNAPEANNRAEELIKKQKSRINVLFGTPKVGSSKARPKTVRRKYRTKR